LDGTNCCGIGFLGVKRKPLENPIALSGVGGKMYLKDFFYTGIVLVIN